jgi:DNA-directed RNA polymerase I subunit RPA2
MASGSAFDTIGREKSFVQPTNVGSTFPILNEFIKPHLESFNALFDDSGLPVGDGDGLGLLSLAIKDIGERVAFDSKGAVGPGNEPGHWGNRMSSELAELVQKMCYSQIFSLLKYGLRMYLLRDLWFLTRI